jgi:hypothetical protein
MIVALILIFGLLAGDADGHVYILSPLRTFVYVKHRLSTPDSTQVRGAAE